MRWDLRGEKADEVEIQWGINSDGGNEMISLNDEEEEDDPKD